MTISIVVLLILVGAAIIIGSNKDRRVSLLKASINQLKMLLILVWIQIIRCEIVKVKGKTNDNQFDYSLRGCQPLKLSGKINEKFMNKFGKGKSVTGVSSRIKRRSGI